MIKNRLLLIIASLYCLFTPGCVERRDFCDCMSLTKAVTDVITLSEEQKEAKQKGCQWIQDELSPAEIARRFAQCNTGRIESESNPAMNTNDETISSYNSSDAGTAPTTEASNEIAKDHAIALIDNDGYAYHEVSICDQTWLIENLNVDRYRNGDIIPEVQDSAEWANLTTGAWCYYENSASYGNVYGKLYNWYAVNDPRGLAPNGWHVPSDYEWKTLINCLGGELVAGGKMKEPGTNHWDERNIGADNSSGFSGISAGNRAFYGPFIEKGTFGQWWSSSNDNTGNGGVFELASFNSEAVIGISNKPNEGFYVRCIRN